jgi:N-acetylneuraminate synthase
MFNNLNRSYLIAEIGVNHEGDFNTAIKQINLAHSAGASAVKFQAYKADKLAARNSPSYWDRKKEPTKTQHELFKKYDSFNQEDYRKLSEHCTDLGLDFSCTPFDTDCLSWLVPLMKFIKIASADLTNDLLLEAVAEFKKPVIISVGASATSEIDRAIEILSKGVDEIVLLHCVLNYPTLPDNAFLHRINMLRLKYGNRFTIGYSDHVAPDTAGDDQVILARGMGVTIFEKHFTHDKSLQGNDHYHAMDRNDLAALRDRLNLADRMINSDYTEAEFLYAQKPAITNARRSLYYARDILADTKVKKSDFIAKRPGTGLPVSNYGALVGKTLSCDVMEDDQVRLDDYFDR